MKLTFEQLPAAIEEVIGRLERIEKLLTERSQPEETYLNTDEAAAFLKLSRATMYGLVHKREIPHTKKSNRVYFIKSDLEEWLKSGRRAQRS